MNQTQTETFSARVTRVLFTGDDGFRILKCKLDRGGAERALVGNLHDAVVGAHLKVTARPSFHPRFGEQWKVERAEVSLPTDREGAAIYLSESPALDLRQARRLVERLGDDLWAACESADRLVAAGKLKPEKADQLARWYRDRRAMKAAWVQLGDWGLRKHQIRGAVQALGADLLGLVEANPWLLAEAVEGVGLKTCDEVARRLGLPMDGEDRGRAVVLHLLREDASKGHCYAIEADLIGRCGELGVPCVRAEGAIRSLAHDGKVVMVDLDDEDTAVYLSALHGAERYVAEQIRERSQPVEGAPKAFIDPADGLTEEQAAAVQMALDYRVMVLTSGPGCIDGTTWMRFATGRRKDGRLFTVEDAFYKFHGIWRKGAKRGRNRFWKGPVRTLSLMEDGGIGYNEIRSIVCTGTKEVFDVRSKGGRRLLVTSDHPFKVPDDHAFRDDEGFVQLRHLKAGDRVVCRREDVKPSHTRGKNRIHRREIHVPLHPRARKKTVWEPKVEKEYEYRLVKEATLVVEAEMNGLDLRTFVDLLQRDEGEVVRPLRFLPKTHEVHHINCDPRDNRLENLEVHTKSGHAREHGYENRLHFGQQQSEVDEIESISRVGQRRVYDLIMAEPYRNYVAGGFVIHNCGKSFTANAIVKAIRKATPGTVHCLAPTGRAAKVLSESVGFEAKTIHRALKLAPGGDCGDEILDGAAVIGDEISMTCVRLMASMLAAIPPHVRLILVGDGDQLPSVGPGRVLRDLIDSGAVPVARLTKVFRQDPRSRIALNCQAVNRGELPDFADASDTALVDAQPDEVAGAIDELLSDAEHGFDPRRDVQVLSPQRKGDAGIEALNYRLQRLLNPDAGQPRWERGGIEIRQGDKVKIRKNDYQLHVYNGEVGFVTRFSGGKDGVLNAHVDLGDRTVVIDRMRSELIELAWACTVHASQGSAFPAVIFVCSSQHPRMLSRQLLYTAVSRPRKYCWVVGDRAAVSRAVENVAPHGRRTRLCALLTGGGK